MTAAFEHVMPWTEEEYLALGETADRVELFDGSLVVSPAPTARHQHLSRRLSNIVDRPAMAAGLEVYLAVNLRLKPGRIPIPDLVLTTPIDLDTDTLVLDVSSVELVCEITSPSNATTDRVLKMNTYAEAGIPWYLIVDPDSLTLSLYRLDGRHYREYATGKPGMPLRTHEPIKVDIDPEVLLYGR